MNKNGAELYNLNCFRFFFCNYLAISYLLLLKYVRMGASNVDVIAGGRLSELLQWQAWGVPFIIWWTFLMIALLVCAAWAVFGRLSVFAAALAVIAFELPMSGTIKPYTTNVVFFALVILSLSPYSSIYSPRQLLKGPRQEARSNSWSIPLLMSLMPAVYFNTMVSKMIGGGWDWLSGRAVQSVLFERYLYTDNPLALWTSNNYLMCLVITILTLSGELIFGLVVFSVWARRIFVPIAFLFHIFIYLIMRINFILMFCSPYFSYINYAWLYGWLKGTAVASSISRNKTSSDII